MYVVFLTGGLASGKTTVAAMLADKGAILVDLDQMAKEEQESPEVLAELAQAFGGDVLDASGKLDRRLLAERAFATAEGATRLNEVCWPPVTRRLTAYLAEARLDPDARGLIVVQVPLLVEAHELIPLADEIVTVSAPEGLRLERAVSRGMEQTDAEQRLARQASDAEREAIAHTVLANVGDIEALRQSLDDWHEARQSRGLL
jgi:dephospho-CoA kinase